MGKWGREWVALTLLSAGSMLGCSSEDDGPTAPAAGAGGTAAAGGTSTGSGGLVSGGAASSGGAGGSSGLLTATDVCIAYNRAQAKRRAECRNETLTDRMLLRGALNCPDDMFAPGSTRTPESLAPCIDTWQTLSCEAIGRNELPSCATPGTLPPGAPCMFGTQCASYLCTGFGRECGTCTAPAKLGEVCGASATCAPGTRCDGVCVSTPAPPFQPPAPPPPRRPDGSPCTVFEQCLETAYCLDNVCTALPVAGQPCSGIGSYCAPSAWCDQTVHDCKPMPREGEPCGARWGEIGICPEPLVCDREGTKTCEGPPALGETCGIPGLDCAEGECLCEKDGCTTKRCLTVLMPNAACPAEKAQCHPGTRCEGGKCVGIALQGLADACR